MKIERDERLIFDDEHRSPQQRANASHNTTPNSAYAPERSFE
jgi:hypothetical protein